MASKNLPQLRYAGFEGEWERHSIYDVATRRKVINVGLQETNLMSLSYGKIKRKDINQKTGLLPASYETYQIVEDGTIVFRFTDLQNDQKSLRVGLSKERGIVSSAYVCVDGDIQRVDPNFFYWLLHYYDTQKVYYKMGAGIRQSINAEDLKELIVKFPRLDEQRALSLECDRIDQLIIQQQEKCEQLRKLKSALLDRLFPKAGHTVPEMRMKGFDGEWINAPLSQYAQRIKRKNKELQSELVMTISSQYGLIDQLEFFNRSVAGADLTNYYLLYNGEFAYNKSYSAGYPWGSVKRLDRYDCGIVSNLYIVFSLSNIDSDYVTTYFMTDHWHKQLAMVAKEGARNHGLLNVSAADFLNINITHPADNEEVQRIGAIIKSYDKLITLNETKLTKLRTLKSAMLDKLFV